MAIKKSKNNESITDFDNMMNEVEEELEVQQAEQQRLPSSMPGYPWNLQSAKLSVKKECSVLP